MPDLIKVSLAGAEFFARHGYYIEEQLLGNRFVVDIDAEFEPATTNVNDEIKNTLNYEQLYNITAHEMKHTKQLLESVAQAIADKIMTDFPYIHQLQVAVKKLNPPLKGRVHASSVTYHNRQKITVLPILYQFVLVINPGSSYSIIRWRSR